MLISGPRHLRPRRFAHAAPAPHRPAARRGAAAVALLAVATFTLAASLTAPGSSPVRSQPVVVAERSTEAPASRGETRTAPPSPAPAPTAVSTEPVGGLTRSEMDNALAIVEVAKRERLPKRAAVVALATALQESHLRNLANPNLPESLVRPNQGVGYDYDSVGLFQQRPNWGSVDQLMDPHESARRFYSALTGIPGWGDYAVTVAAQMVQRSAFPDAYAKWESLATQIADATM
ncbi:hypothetical protein [Dactylosporangium matsuzakiense]|uniref:Uncharacterized protein n=1 Tax=Dactylosporangium matsuzakiense TaxID=53360 RepID=A0A9W6KPQ9_9ACTN|nr:hypothetical protein [Dactylosporangium matsuzakiense]UWZ42961.1 hypothetical protein Dmats_36440 [Dactylosporangium matsuzakiense]GLL03279.1 hypothetical protein GCM10017581_050230 [Dactylosporangium matsuzakiense]